MTIPIMPGPFSFLAGAGQALGAYGEAKTQAQHYADALALQRQQASLQAAQFLSRIISPEAFAQGGVGGNLLQQAGVGPIAPGQIEVPSAVQQSRRYGQELANLPVGSPQSQESVGISTPGRAAADKALQAESNVTAQGLENLTPDQIAAKLGIPSDALAKLMEKAKTESLRTDILSQDPARTELRMQQDIAQSVRDRLPREPEFARVADYAKVGAVGYLEHQLEAWARMNEGSKALNTEKVKTVLATTQQAAAEYRQAHAQWVAGLQKAVKGVTDLGGPGQGKDPKEVAKLQNDAAKDYIERFGEEPKAGEYLDAAIEANGLDKASYQQAYRDLVHVTGAKPPGNNFQAVLDANKTRKFTDAEIDASTTLSPEQKAQLKALNKGKK